MHTDYALLADARPRSSVLYKHLMIYNELTLLLNISSYSDSLEPNHNHSLVRALEFNSNFAVLN